MSRKGWLLFIAMSVIWGIPYFFIAIAVKELDPTVVVFARVAIAAIVLLPIAIRRNQLKYFRKSWLMIAGLTILQILAPFLLISFGEQHIASSLTSLLISSEPLLVALFALRLAPGERVSGLRLIGLIIGMAGVVVLLGLDASGDGQELLGAILVLLATMGYAISALLVRRPTIAALPSFGIVTIECIVSTILLAPLAALRLPDRMPSLEVMVSLLVLGLVCTALAYLTFFALIAEVGTSRGVVFTYINPIISVLLGVLLLSESFNISTVVGLLLILLGSWLSTSGTNPLVKRLFRTRPRQIQDAIESDVPIP